MKNKIIEILIGAAIVLVALKAILDPSDHYVQTIGQPISHEHYIDVDGNKVSLDDYQGNHVWIDYAAEWCNNCEPQTETLKALERQYGDKLLFITVVTGTDKVMEPPKAETARAWANRYDLPYDRVLAHFSTNTLPYHILYSPTGKILHRGSGVYSAPQIRQILRAKTSLLD